MRLTTTERYAGYIVPREARAVTDAMGVAVLQVWPNELGTESSEYAVSVTFPDACAANSSIAPMRSIRGNCVVPNADCNLQDIMELPAYEPRSAGQAVETEVAHWASLAAQYSEGARASMQGAQSVETRLNATADVASASRLAAQEAAQSASASATRAQGLVDGVSSTISHFQNSVVEQTAETVERLTVDATTSIGQHKASALDEIGAKVETVMDESIASLTQARSESMIPFIPKAGLWWADETISAHCWRWHINGVRSWPRKVVDALALLFGDKNHCQQSYESERLGRQLPPEERTLK